MDKKQFVATLNTPVHFTSQDRGWLRAIEAKYPYSSVVSTMALLADHAYGFDDADRRHATALAMCNSSQLDDMLSRATPPAAPDETPTDILSEINTFQEVSFKTAPKSVILSSFLNDGPADVIERTLATPESAPVDDKKSLRPDDSLATETLAVILERQGKYDKAAEIYRKLLAANPEKSSIFAARIRELENK